VKTEELMDILSTDVTPVKRHTVNWAIGIAIAGGSVCAIACVLLALGVRGDLANGTVLAYLLTKIAFALTTIAVASTYLTRLARPGGERKTNAAAIIAPFAVIVLLAAVSLFWAPGSHWNKMVAETDWLECVLSIPIIAVAPFAITVWAVRKTAPTNLVRTGAVAGLFAGGMSALGYALHCTDDSLPFVAIWYGGTIAMCTLAGAMLGPRLVRW
jgi:hypothetical protein